MKSSYKKNKLQIITFLILGTLPLFIDSYYLDNFSYFKISKKWFVIFKDILLSF